MKNVIIIGYGGFGREIAWLAEDCGYSVRGFLDDGVAPGEYDRHRVIGAVEEWVNFPSTQFVVAIGNPRIRKAVVKAMRMLGNPAFASLVHPSVVQSNSGSIGEGSVICAGTVGTVGFSIGDHVIVNINCTIGHDANIDDYVTVAPLVALSGNVTLENGVEVGTAAAIRQGVTMGAGSMLGMGGALTTTAEANTLYVGVPAKAKKQLSPF